MHNWQNSVREKQDTSSAFLYIRIFGCGATVNVSCVLSVMEISLDFREHLRNYINLISAVFRLLLSTENWTVDGDNHDLNENGAEDDMDKEVNGYDGCHGDSAAEVAGGTEASVSAARVAVHRLLLCLTNSYFLLWINVLMHSNTLYIIWRISTNDLCHTAEFNC